MKFTRFNFNFTYFKFNFTYFNLNLTYFNFTYFNFNLNFTYFNLNLTYFNLNFTYFNLNFTYLNLNFTYFNLNLTYFNLNFTDYNLNFTHFNLKFTFFNLKLKRCRKLFKSLLELSVLNSFFMFNNRFYKQIQGLGMGLPLGPTFASIFMCHHEQNWLDNCPDDFKQVLYNRYVDDTFVLFKDPSHAPLFHNYINSMLPNIRFTVDRECQNHLTFLDCNANRKTNCFDISVYRKNNFSGLGLSFFSFCSFNFKVNSIKTLLARAYSICSTYQNFHEELFIFLKTMVILLFYLKIA